MRPNKPGRRPAGSGARCRPWSGAWAGPASPQAPGGTAHRTAQELGHRCGSNLQRLWGGSGQLGVGTGLCLASMGSSTSPGALATFSLSCCLWPGDLQAFCSKSLSLGIPGLEDLGQHPFLPSSVPEAVLSSAAGLSLGRPACQSILAAPAVTIATAAKGGRAVSKFSMPWVGIFQD